MMRSMLRIAVPVVALVLTACDSPYEPQPEPEPIAVVVTVNPTTMDLQVGETKPLTATVQNALNAAVTWRSANPAVASVSLTGAVTGVGPGSTLVTAISVADTMKRATAQVTVTGGTTPPGPLSIPVLGLGAVNERFTAEVAVRGDIAYTTTWGNRGAPGNTMKIWNVAGNTPQLLDSVRVGNVSTTGDVQISDDGTLLVVPSEGPGLLTLYDRTNPVAPRLIRQWSHAETAPGVHTVKLGKVNGRHFAFLSINPGVNGARLLIVDITDPANPALVWSERMGNPYVHDVFVRDGILFAALWHDGLRIYDIGGGNRGGTPAAPVVMSNIVPRVFDPQANRAYIHNVWWFHDPTTGGRKYVFLGEENTTGVGFFANSSKGDIHVIDVSDMSNPKQVAHFGVTGAGTHNFSMDEASGILYAAYYNGGVRAIDVRGDLSACTAQQRNNFGHCDLRAMGREVGVALANNSYIWGVAWQDGFLYASDMRQGLFKLDTRALRR